MTQPDLHHPSAEPILDRLHRLVSTVTVFGDPIERDGLTVIPAARVTTGGGRGREVDQAAEREGDGGGAGLLARPIGAFIINGGRVTWKPAVTIETVATLVILAVTWLARRK